mgnify:CR=1 FL=1
MPMRGQVSLRLSSHSAPVRVLPHPRPARINHVRQSPAGGRCDGRAAVANHDRRAASMGVDKIRRSNVAANAERRGEFCGKFGALAWVRYIGTQ